MKEKLTLQDLVDLLAKSAGLTKKEADAFLREFLSVITDSIFNGEQVKIKDFGTFKLTSVKSRESVNVNTGEKIEIPAHHKLSFIPDKSLKELVNKPFEQFETTLLEDSISFESIEESEDPVDASEDEDTGIDELDSVTKQADEKPEVFEPENIEIVEVPVLEKIEDEFVENGGSSTIEKDEISEVDVPEEGLNEVVDVNKASYVYTYTTEPERGEGDGRITIAIPKDQVGSVVSDNQNTQEEKIKKYSANTDFLADEDAEIGEEIPLNINKVQEKIDQLKEAIDALARVNQSDNTDEKGLESEVGEIVEEDNLLPDFSLTPVDNQVETVVADNASIDENVVLQGSGIEGVAGEVEGEGFDQDLLKPLEEEQDTSIQPTAVVEKLVSEQDDDDDDDFDYYSYQKDTAWSRLRRRLPILIFLLIVILFGGYHFVKLFEQKTDYNTNGFYRSLSDVDTLPNVKEIEEITPSLFDQDVDTMAIGSSLLSPLDDQFDSSLRESADTIKQIEVEDASGGAPISNNLYIKVLRKAAYLKHGGQEIWNENVAPKNGEKLAEGVKPQEDKVSTVKLPANEAVKPGETLRVISRKYYGKGDFWVYIYEENKAKLKSIDDISIGQELVVPDLKKYNINVNDPEALKKAKALEGKIYSSIARP